MKREKSVKFNALLNSAKMIISIGIHLITIPYASRILVKAHYGKVSFANSIIQYLALFAMLGISTYAQREGPRFRDNHQKFEDFASQLFTINVISTVLSYIMMAVLLLFAMKLRDYRILILVQSVIIVLTTIGADWINQIYEDYFYMTVRYIIVEIIALISLFIFVRTPSDYVNYAFIMVMSAAGGNLFNVFYVRRYAKLHFTPLRDCRQHLKPVIKLFFVNLATVLYISSDITILGYFRDNATVGVYTLASKIYSTIKNVINAVILVALPRLSFYLGHQMDHEYNALLKKIYDYLITLLLPVIAGLFILSKPIMLIVGGMQYSDGYVPLALLSLSLLFAALACYFATSIILLYKQDNVYLMATLISCFSNVALNFILIPYMGYVGASLTTLIAEMLMCLITWYYSLKLPNIQEHKVYLFADRSVLISSIIGSLGILVIGLLIKDVVGNPFINVGITFVLSVLFYFIILLIFKNPILTLFMKKLKIKLKR